MRRAAIALLFVSMAAATVNITTVAAATTIGVNALEIKTHVRNTIKAYRAARKAAAKAVKKVSGK